MCRLIAIALICVSSLSFANDCSRLEGSGDGVPATYFIEKCFADKAFLGTRYTKAASHYEKASSVLFHEAPNYRLRLQWAESLCLAGNAEKGFRKLNSFILLAKADLGYFECPEDIMDIPDTEHMHLACVGYGSILSEQAKKDLVKDLERANTIEELCNSV